MSVHSRMPTPRTLTCGMTSAPRARAASTPASTSRQSSGWFWFCTSPNMTGRRLVRATASIHSSSPSVPPAASPTAPNGASSNTPALHSASTAGERVQLRRIGEGSRDGVASRRLVPGGARRGHAERAGRHGLAQRRLHGREIVRTGALVRRTTLAHRVDAQRAVSDVGADVQPERASSRGTGSTRGKDSHPHGMPAAMAARGHVLDAFHQEHEIVAVGGATGREADAAVPHHHRGDAVEARRRAERVPGDLRVEMGVDVDEAGRDQLAARVDHLAGGTVVASDAGDAIADHGDVGLVARTTAAVDDEAAADHEIGTHGRVL